LARNSSEEKEIKRLKKRKEEHEEKAKEVSRRRFSNFGDKMFGF